MGTMVYNLNNSAVNVLCAKQIKENIFISLLHRDGKGITEHVETDVSTLRILKPAKATGAARKLGVGLPNGGWFNNKDASTQDILEFDLPLLYVFDQVTDIPTVQDDLVPVSVLEAANKNIAGRITTEVNSSTLAIQLANRLNAAVANDASWAGVAVVVGTGDKAAYDAIMDASSALDDGDEDNGIQAFPFEEREIILRPSFRRQLMSQNGVIIGGSNYAQSMVAKGALSPDAMKEFGNMYVGEIDGVPCYLCSAPLWKRAGEWVGNDKAFDGVEAIMCAASATDRGISPMSNVKIIDSPAGQGRRLQPLVRWGALVTYEKGIVPIIANGVDVPRAALTVTAPGNVA